MPRLCPTFPRGWSLHWPVHNHLSSRVWSPVMHASVWKLFARAKHSDVLIVWEAISHRENKCVFLTLYLIWFKCSLKLFEPWIFSCSSNLLQSNSVPFWFYTCMILQLKEVITFQKTIIDKNYVIWTWLLFLTLALVEPICGHLWSVQLQSLNSLSSS